MSYTVFYHCENIMSQSKRTVLDNVSSTLTCHACRPLGLILILCGACFMSINSEKIPIYIGGFFSHTGDWDSSGILPAVQMALDHINERSDILTDYDLKMVWNDTGCTGSLATRVLIYQLYNEPKKLLLIGDGCSTATRAIAGTAPYFNLNTVSYAATAPALSNREDFPYFYRTIQPDNFINAARVALMQKFGWNRVGTIHGKHEIFSLAVDHLRGKLHEANITVITSETFASDDPTNQIQNLKVLDSKIIAGNMYATKARRLLCEAYRNGMVGAGYIWMFVGWYAPKWWEETDETPLPCNLKEMRQAVENSYYISIETLQLSPSSDVTVANITSAQYVDLLGEYLKQPEWDDYTEHNDSPLGYDAAWTIALMFNKSIPILEESGRRLENFTYDDEYMGQLFFDLLSQTDFLGVSGPVSFRDADRLGILQIRQLQGNCDNSSWKAVERECYLFVKEQKSYKDAGEHCRKMGSEVTEDEMHGKYMWRNNNLTKLSFNCKKHQEFREERVALFSEDEELYNEDGSEWNGERLIWPGGDTKAPLDHTPSPVVPQVHLGISDELYAIMCIFTTIAIMLALFFLAFNLKYRNQRFVKMSSPNLNNLIIMGSVLVYASIFIAGLHSHHSHQSHVNTCQVQAWLLSTGFVLAFGSMFSKTWRVHKIAAFKTPKRKIITDKQLILTVLILLSIDIIILVIWTTIDPMVVQTQYLPETEDSSSPTEKFIPFYKYCSCMYFIYWIAALYSYKALLLIFGAFLAWEIRKVNFPALNDSKLIGISVYNVIVLCTIGVSVSFIISSDPAKLYIFTSCVVIFCTTTSLAIVFVPKIISVYKYPDGPPRNKVSVPYRSSVSTTDQTNNDDQQEIRQRLAAVEAENKRLKEQGNTNNRWPDKYGCGILLCGAIKTDNQEVDSSDKSDASQYPPNPIVTGNSYVFDVSGV